MTKLLIELNKKLTEASRTDFSRLKGPVPMVLWVCCPEFGWMDLKLNLGHEPIFFYASDVYPPFLNLLGWVETIMRGQRTDTVVIDAELREHYFNAERVGDEGLVELEFSVETLQGVVGYHRAVVEVRNFVEEWYLVFKYLNELDLEAEDNKPEGTAIWFDFAPESEEYIKFDLSRIEAYLLDQ